ncbi:copper-fist-domain-containing protein [Backusella circina FSU 941]|nr:copper-fist-domain-containing protein [Backusella circina FSU 941]KAI8884980.1 copper-fist-domain-containing protein [Backusella circina FSU 941]
MIVIDNKKFACHSCIKGHRSSRCGHLERTLIAVRKKGRPLTQCDQCREQRKNKKIHQKCICPKRKEKMAIANRASVRAYTTRRIMSIDTLLL